MQRDFFDPTVENTNVVLIPDATLRRAERSVRACEACAPDDAQFPFDVVLDAVTGEDPSVTDYLLARPGCCPRCQGTLVEKTLVDWNPDDQDGGTTPPQEPTLAKHFATPVKNR